jgi:hypothetical protein
MQSIPIEKIRAKAIKARADKPKQSRIRKESKELLRQKRRIAQWLKDNF